MLSGGKPISAYITAVGVVLISPIIPRQPSLCILLSIVIATLYCVLSNYTKAAYVNIMLLSVLPANCMFNIPYLVSIPFLSKRAS